MDKEKKKRGNKWSYRMIAIPDGEDYYFQIHEIYWDKDGEPTGWSDAVGAGGNSPMELYDDLMLMHGSIHHEMYIEVDDKLVETTFGKLTGKIRDKIAHKNLEEL